MDWKLIFGLSMFGLAMAVGTVFVIPPNIEPILWGVIFLICAFMIARARSGGHFWHGLLVGIVNSVWVTAAHIIFFDQYLAGHAREATMSALLPPGKSLKFAMAIIGPVIGVISGIVMGVLAWIFSKFVKPRAAATA
jgi:hypothetical protein